METTRVRLLMLSLFLLGIGTHAFASDDYFLSPSEKVTCTIHPANSDGTRDAVGTDLNTKGKIIMETVRIDANGYAYKTWTIDRETRNISEGGQYNVFREKCLPLVQTLPTELRAKFEPLFRVN